MSLENKNKLSAVSRALYKARMDMGLSRDSLGYMAGITPQTILNIEHDRKPPNISTLEKLANVLESTVEDLIVMGKNLKLAEEQNLRKIVAENIRYVRLSRNITQQYLASKAGLSIATIRNIEACRNSATLDALESLARALSISPMELLNPKLRESAAHCD